MSYLYHNKGIYGCNTKFFANKLDAIVESNQSGQQVTWDYHDAVFTAHDWCHEPEASLADLYRARAQQLRDNYDHLVLFYSGGVDSWQILKAFIDNNIRLDEIYMFGAFEAEERHLDKLGWNQDPGYYTREIRQSLPLLRQLVADRGIKINVFDWTQHILAAANDPDWFWNAGVRFDPTCMVRAKFHKIFREHSELLHRGRRVGFVYGIDKPRLIRDDRNIYFAFVDLIMTTGTLPTNDILNEYWENDEYFYWTPNMPALAIKQSHVVVNWLRSRNKLGIIKHVDNLSGFHDEAYYAEVNRAIYPDWNPHTWQIKKPKGPIYNELSKWFFDGHFEARIKWEASLFELERLIGQRWFNQNTVAQGLKGHISPMYRVTEYTATVDQ